MLERDIEKYLVEQVKKTQGRAYKFVSPGNVGVPDRIVLLPGGKTIFVELKATGKKPTPIQNLQGNRMRALGHEVLVIDSKAAVDNFILEYGGGAHEI